MQAAREVAARILRREALGQTLDHGEALLHTLEVAVGAAAPHLDEGGVAPEPAVELQREHLDALLTARALDQVRLVQVMELA
jgi:hypothetical protein